MRRTRVNIAVMLAVMTLLVAGEAPAQVHFLSSLDRNVASVGESFVFTVELLATTTSVIERDSLRSAFNEISLESPAPDLELVRSLTPRVILAKIDPYTVVHLTRKFVLRAMRPGRMETPFVRIQMDEGTYQTGGHDFIAYHLEPRFAQAQRSVVPLVVESRVGDAKNRTFLGHGSGFLVAEDALVTAYHVVVNANRIRTILPNGSQLELKKAWAVDALRDVAVLYIDPDETREANLVPLEVAARDFRSTSNRFDREPEIVFTAGWPSGVQRSQAGVLFAVNQYYDNEAIWLSSNFVRPGDSGGPLLNAKGQVIGVISYAMSGKRSRTQPLENVTTSTDPRPALARRLLRKSPHGIKRYTRKEFFEHDPHALAAKVTSVLTEFSDPKGRYFIGGIDPFLRELDRAVSKEREEARLHFLQGSVYQMLGEYVFAKAAYEQALVQSADHIPAAYSLAYCQLALKSYDTAAELFTFIKEFEPYEHLGLYGLAQAELQLLDYAEAISNLSQVIYDHPDFAPGLYLLGRAYVGSGQEEMAIQIEAKLQLIDRRWAELLKKTRLVAPFKPVRRFLMPRADVR